MTPELFKAILAMDSYNRGPTPGLDVEAAGASVTQIGNATLGLNSDDPIANMKAAALAAGFFAQSYTWNGTTVISYRGTDNPGFFASANGPSDIVNGWIAGVGVPTSQVSLAIEFYKTVTGTTNIFGGAAANTILTGHSLGGGLAGMVAALTGTQAQIYDHMPFGLAAWLEHELDPSRTSTQSPKFSAFKGISVTGEVLQFVRDGSLPMGEWEWCLFGLNL